MTYEDRGIKIPFFLVFSLIMLTLALFLPHIHAVNKYATLCEDSGSNLADDCSITLLDWMDKSYPDAEGYTSMFFTFTLISVILTAVAIVMIIFPVSEIIEKIVGPLVFLTGLLSGVTWILENSSLLDLNQYLIDNVVFTGLALETNIGFWTLFTGAIVNLLYGGYILYSVNLKNEAI